MTHGTSDAKIFGAVVGHMNGGLGGDYPSPIEGLPDVERSSCASAVIREPPDAPHQSLILPGTKMEASVVTEEDLEESARMKGFGGDQATRMILQALGKQMKGRSKGPRAGDWVCP